MSLRLTAATKALNSLTELVEQVDAMEDVKEMALAYHDQIVPAMAALRKPVDEMDCWWISPSGRCPPTAT